MSRVLVDTSVWIEMFTQRDAPAVQALGELLRARLVCTHGLVRAEVLSGARSDADYRRLADRFSALDLLKDPPDLWERVARARYRLARQGFQAGVADLIIAAAASYHRKTLFTLDRDFGRIGRAIPVPLFKPPEH